MSGYKCLDKPGKALKEAIWMTGLQTYITNIFNRLKSKKGEQFS